MVLFRAQDFARLPWQNQPSQSVPTLAGHPLGSSVPTYAPNASGQANGSTHNHGHCQAAIVNGGLHQASESGADDLELRGQIPLRLDISFISFAAFSDMYLS